MSASRRVWTSSNTLRNTVARFTARLISSHDVLVTGTINAAHLLLDRQDRAELAWVTETPDPHKCGCPAVFDAATAEHKIVSRKGNVFRGFADLAAWIAEHLPVESAVLDAEIACVDDSGHFSKMAMNCSANNSSLDIVDGTFHLVNMQHCNDILRVAQLLLSIHPADKRRLCRYSFNSRWEILHEQVLAVTLRSHHGTEPVFLFSEMVPFRR